MKSCWQLLGIIESIFDKLAKNEASWFIRNSPENHQELLTLPLVGCWPPWENLMHGTISYSYSTCTAYENERAVCKFQPTRKKNENRRETHIIQWNLINKANNVSKMIFIFILVVFHPSRIFCSPIVFFPAWSQLTEAVSALVKEMGKIGWKIRSFVSFFEHRRATHKCTWHVGNWFFSCVFLSISRFLLSISSVSYSIMRAKKMFYM